MCCRLNINQNELIQRPGHIFAAGDSTGSIGVVTLNVNRLGYEAKDKKEFFEKVEHYMRIAKDSLELKREVINKNLENGLMPFTKVYLGHINNHFSTIGLCGMNEACLNLIGEDISSPEGKQLTIETLNFMRNSLKSFQKETGSLYNLEASPAEGASYRLAREDKKMYPDIRLSGESAPFLTNSTQLPVDYTDDLIAALEHQNDIQPLYTGGTIFHTFLGERLNDWKAARILVRKIAENTRIPYFSISPTFSICPVHGYIRGEHHYCPYETNGTNKAEIDAESNN
jgi:ribonucleoside-triphosphate reductase